MAGPSLPAASPVVLAAALLAVATAAPAAPQQGGAHAVVTVTTAAGAPVADHEVRLEVHDARETVDTRTGRTDAAGAARFPDLPAGPGLHLRPVVEYGGVDFGGETAPVEAAGPVSLAVQVYETTQEGRPVHVDRLHLIVSVEGPGLARVAQVMLVRNVGELPWIGEEDDQGRPRAGIAIPLPERAQQAGPIPPPNGGLDPESLAFESDRILDLRPLPLEGRSVAVSYDLVGDADGMDFDLTMPYPTASVDLLLGGPGAEALEVDAPGFQELGPQEIGAEIFRSYSSDVVPAGGSVSLRLSPAGLAISAPTWALIGLGAALLLAVGGSLVASRAPAPVDRDTLIARVARLDADHAAGRVSDAEYHDRRAVALEELLVLDRRRPRPDRPGTASEPGEGD